MAIVDHSKPATGEGVWCMLEEAAHSMAAEAIAVDVILHAVVNAIRHDLRQ